MNGTFEINKIHDSIVKMDWLQMFYFIVLSIIKQSSRFKIDFLNSE